VAGTSEDTFQLCAERGMVPLTSGIAGPRVVRGAAASFLQARRVAGLPVDSWELGAQSLNLVTASEAEARGEVHRARWQNRAGRSLTRRAVVDGRVDPSPYEGEPSDEAFWDGLCYGDPERVTRQYRALSDAGATFASCWMMAGGMPHERIMQSIRLMGEQVIPALRDVHPPADLLARLEAETATDAGPRPASPSG
jgi:hypothetical protein